MRRRCLARRLVRRRGQSGSARVAVKSSQPRSQWLMIRRRMSCCLVCFGIFLCWVHLRSKFGSVFSRVSNFSCCRHARWPDGASVGVGNEKASAAAGVPKRRAKETPAAKAGPTTSSVGGRRSFADYNTQGTLSEFVEKYLAKQNTSVSNQSPCFSLFSDMGLPIPQTCYNDPRTVMSWIGWTTRTMFTWAAALWPPSRVPGSFSA